MNAVTLLFRVLLALSLFSAIPLLVSCSGGGTPPTAAELAADAGGGGGGGDVPGPIELPGVPSNIILESTNPSPAVIGITGAGATESIILTFQIVDINNDPVTGAHVVDFEILHGGLNGGEKLNNVQAASVDSKVTTVFNSGIKAGTVQIRASLHSDSTMQTDVTVAITGGLPSGNAFGLSFGPLNIEGLITHGLTQEVRTDISDYFSNPVAPNVQVSFQTDYASVLATGTFASSDATASVFMSTVTTSSPDPEDGFVQVSAQTIGGNHSKVLALAVDPIDENIVYAGTDGGGVFKTTDAGTSWKIVGGPLKETGAAKFANLKGTIVRDLVIISNASEVIYAATDKGVFISTNGGENWSTITGRRRILADNLGVTTGFDVDPTNPTNGIGWQVFNFNNEFSGVRSRMKVLVGGVETTDFDFSGDGIFILDDFGGGHLDADLNVEVDYDAESSVPWPVYALAVNPDPADYDVNLGHAKTIWAGTYGDGVWKTVDGGRNWVRASTMANGQGVSFGKNVLSLAINSAAPTELLAGSDGDGLFKTVNGGTTWTKQTGTMAKPINETEVRSITLLPAAPVAMVWIAGKNGIHYSTDGGVTWNAPVTKISDTDPTNADARAIVRDDVDGTLYVASFGDVLDRSEPHGGVYKSVDNGVNWSKVADLPATTGAHALDSLAVVGQAGADLLYAGSEGRSVFKSLDSGGTWAAVNGNTPTNLNNTLFTTGEVMHSGHLQIDIVPLGASLQGMGLWSDGIYNTETVRFYVQVADWEHGNRLVGETTITISTDAGSSTSYDATLADGVYGGTDYPVSWQNDLDGDGEQGCLTVSVDGTPYGTHSQKLCYYMHGIFTVSPTSLDLTMAAGATSVAEAVSSSGGSDHHQFANVDPNGTIPSIGGLYVYTNPALSSGEVIQDTITVTDNFTGQSIDIPVTITKE